MRVYLPPQIIAKLTKFSQISKVKTIVFAHFAKNNAKAPK
jgi:hypothetical protein